MGEGETLLALAERCEKAMGPERGTDLDIMRHVMNIGGPAENALPYTASIDAALTLLPEGWRTVIRDRGRREADKPKWFARLESADFSTVTFGKGETWITEITAGHETSSWAATPALALCAAALRARATQDQPNA